MSGFFKHEICDDIPQLLILELQVMKPPKVRIIELIVRDKGADSLVVWNGCFLQR